MREPEHFRSHQCPRLGRAGALPVPETGHHEGPPRLLRLIRTGCHDHLPSWGASPACLKQPSASPCSSLRPSCSRLSCASCASMFTLIVLLDGSAQSRGAGARLAGKREFPKGDRPAFREVARRIPPTSPSGRHHPGARASRPHAVPFALPLSFPAMLQPTALPAGTAWARPKQRQGAAAG